MNSTSVRAEPLACRNEPSAVRTELVEVPAPYFVRRLRQAQPERGCVSCERGLP